MIGINMKMPDSCEECRFKEWDNHLNRGGWFCICNGGYITIDSLNNKRKDCPLIDLDKENNNDK